MVGGEVVKILSVEFVSNWSWGLIFNQMKNLSKHKIERVFMSDTGEVDESKHDMVLIQNVTLLEKVKNKIRSVCRLGGNRSFENRNIAPILESMSKCYALIATNKKLFEIAKSVNENSYLIPNGLDIREWKPRNSSFVVGFCGNIAGAQYRQYKGFDFVKEACENLGLELKTALYKDQQIPHDRMMEDFYYKIDCLVHPTLGEGCSNTLMEACACGVPIITTREAGFHGEMMEDGVDVLFCERTTESIQNKIKMLSNDAALRWRLSSGARLFAERHHDISKIASQYETIFDACHANAPRDMPVISECAPQEKEKRRFQKSVRRWHNGKIVRG